MKKLTLFTTLFLVASSSFAQWNLSNGMGTDYSGSRETRQADREFRQQQNIQRQQRYFKGYPCTDDCSGHIAGYSWAARKGIDDTRKCGGNSQSFFEGCLAYADGR